MTGKPSGDGHRERIEQQLDLAFTQEGTIVEARLDPVLCGLANELFAEHHLAGFAVSALVLDRCRRTLTERYGDEQFGTAAASVLKDVFETVGRDAVLQAIRKIAEGEHVEGDVLGRAFDLTTRNAFRRGRRNGVAIGMWCGFALAMVTAAVTFGFTKVFLS